MAWSQLIEIDIPKVPYEFHLHGFCDLQLGSNTTSISMIKTAIHDIVKDPVDSGIIIPGDIEDEDRPSTRMMRRQSFAGREEVIHRDAQKHMRWLDQEVIPMLMPLQKTKYGIMGILAGHHWTQISPALNSVQYICQRLTDLSKRKVPYLGVMMSYMDFRFRVKEKMTIRKYGVVVHGEGAGQTKSATIQKLERLAQGFSGDFFIRGHDCQLLSTKTPKLRPREVHNQRNEPEMIHDTITYLNLGAYTKAYDMSLDGPSYVEEKLLRPTTMGSGYLRFIFRYAHPWEDKNKSIMCGMRVDI